MYSAEEIEQIRQKIETKMARLEEDIVSYKELTKPISPENAIGRISRMDAINNKSVNEAALRNAQAKHKKLEHTLGQLTTEGYGRCRQCGSAIELAKLLVMPESVRCVTCVKSGR